MSCTLIWLGKTSRSGQGTLAVLALIAQEDNTSAQVVSLVAPAVLCWQQAARPYHQPSPSLWWPQIFSAVVGRTTQPAGMLLQDASLLRLFDAGKQGPSFTKAGIFHHPWQNCFGEGIGVTSKLSKCVPAATQLAEPACVSSSLPQAQDLLGQTSLS